LKGIERQLYALKPARLCFKPHLPMQELVKRLISAAKGSPIMIPLEDLDDRHRSPIRFGFLGTEPLVGFRRPPQFRGRPRRVVNGLDELLEVSLGEPDSTQMREDVHGLFG
jgi:hypothetical protein